MPPVQTQTDPGDLTTVEDAMAWLTVTNVAEADIIQFLVTAASQDFLQRTGKDTLNSVLPFNEWYDGSGSNRQFVRNAPIISVLSVAVDGRVLAASTSLSTSGYVIDQSRKSLSIRLGGCAAGSTFRGRGEFFAKGMQNVNIQYTAGYSLQQNEPQQVPAATPWQLTVNNATDSNNDNIFNADQGVRYRASGVSLTAVPSAPAQGEYSVDPAGQYTFSEADAEENILIAYTYNAAPLDVQVAVKRMVSLAYKRRPQEDLRSKMLTEGGTTLFRDFELPIGVQSVINEYTRRAVV